MGEIADMMLDGTLCEGCGEFMGDYDDLDSAPGYPRYCSPQCAGNSGQAYTPAERSFSRSRSNKKAPLKKIQCTSCKKFFATDAAQKQHAAIKHAAAAELRNIMDGESP